MEQRGKILPHIQMHKNEGFLSINIMPKALHIIEKYNYKLPVISCSKMNKYIKAGMEAGIEDEFVEDDFSYKSMRKLVIIPLEELLPL